MIKSKLLNTSILNNLGQRIQPNVIVGDSNGFSSGDILDANAIVQALKDGTIEGGSSSNVEGRLSNIESVIPSHAYDNGNELADKNFVNSSIATNTATFRGTYGNENDLPTSGVNENDYAFVMSVDQQGDPEYARYKFSTIAGSNEPSWIYEYTLNNSSFTAAQWAAINSGITSSTVSELNNLVHSGDVRNIVVLTQAQYDALADKDDYTEYNIIES